MSASVDSSLVAAAGACKCHTWLLGCQVAWLPPACDTNGGHK